MNSGTCLCHTTGGPCPLHEDTILDPRPVPPGPGLHLYSACDNGHDWLPWLEINPGSWWTKCTRCGREEQFDK